MSLETSIRKAIVESLNDSDLNDEDKKLSQHVAVSFTETEYRQLLAASEKAVTKVQTWIRRAVATTLLNQKIDLVTPRERAVMALVAEGHCNRIIGKKLDISAHTVKFHITNVMQKFDVDSRAGVAAVAVRLGLA